MAYWRTYKNKYGATLNRVLVYTAKDKAKQRERRTYYPYNVNRPRMYRKANLDVGIQWLFVGNDYRARIQEYLAAERESVLFLRATLKLTLLWRLGKANYDTGIRINDNKVARVSPSGDPDYVRGLLNDVQYRLKRVQWIAYAIKERTLYN